MDYCIQTRYGRFLFDESYNKKFPAEFTADVNAFRAESRLLSILKDAGYTAEYILDAKSHPTALQIRIPPGRSASGYSDAEETIILTPHVTGGRKAFLKVSASRQKPTRKRQKP